VRARVGVKAAKWHQRHTHVDTSVSRGLSRLPVVDHVGARFVTQRHRVSQVPMRLVMNVGGGGPRMTLLVTPCAIHDGASRVGYPRPPMAATDEARKTVEHRTETISGRGERRGFGSVDRAVSRPNLPKRKRPCPPRSSRRREPGRSPCRCGARRLPPARLDRERPRPDQASGWVGARARRPARGRPGPARAH
jgi:hypothetical protein